MLLTGLRGVGKTVLLNEIDRKAKEEGYRTILIEAHEGKTLGALIAPHLWKLLFELELMAGLPFCTTAHAARLMQKCPAECPLSNKNACSRGSFSSIASGLKFLSF